MKQAKNPCYKPPLLQGFMLIEIALVLMLVAVILGPILQLIAGQRSKSVALEQLENRQKITEAVEGFVLATGRLPCPALDKHGTEARTGNACQQREGWLPSATLHTWGLPSPWRMAVATLEEAGAPARNALLTGQPFEQLSPQQLSEIIFAPISVNHALGTGPLPAIHLCQQVAGQALPVNSSAGCGTHTLISPSAVWVAYPVNVQVEGNINLNRFQQFFINPVDPMSNPVWISYERMNWLWMKRGALDNPLPSGELN
jgi:type II secretory pathway pseudopilin PulG